jgi:hypothetical protein
MRSKVSQRLKVSERLRRAVANLVESAEPEAYLLQLYREGYFWEQPNIASAVGDIYSFRYQNREFTVQKAAQFVVPFRDDGPGGEILPVVVLAPDLQNLTTSYQRFLKDLRTTNLPLEEVCARNFH